MPVIEIVSFAGSEALLADPTVADFRKTLDYVKKNDGCLGLYRGFQLEDRTQVFLIISWESYEKYENMTKREDYPAFRREFQESGLPASELLIQHVEIDGDPADILDAAVTELRFCQPKNGNTLEKMDAVVAGFVSEHDEAKYGKLPSWGRGPVKTPGLYVYAIGWESVESRHGIINSAAFVKAVVGIREIAELDIKCVSLTKA